MHLTNYSVNKVSLGLLSFEGEPPPTTVPTLSSTGEGWRGTGGELNEGTGAEEVARLFNRATGRVGHYPPSVQTFSTTAGRWRLF